MFDRLVPEALAGGAVDHLVGAGVVRGAIVGWLGHNSWDLVATLVACERIGAVLMPLNWRLAPAELARIVDAAGAGHLIGTPEVGSLASAVLAALPLRSLRPGPADGVVDGDLLLIYTSGTTGEPKGAMHTAAGLRANAVAAIAAQRLDASTRALAVLPLFHVGGLCIQTLPTLAAGGRVHLQPRFDADAWFDAVAAWRPTTSLLVPAVMKSLIDHPRWAGADLSSLAFVTTGSQVVPRALIDAFHARGVAVAQVYGCTESGPVSIVLRPDEAMTRAGSAGRPAVGVRVRLGDDGEVRLKGANLMRGYHRAAASGFDADGWFRTGDLARVDADGYVEIVGRADETIISGGENIHPAEIESIVAALPGVAGCAVVGVPDDRWGEVPVLAVVRDAGAAGEALVAGAIVDALGARVARFKLPARVHFIDALPTTALGKVARRALAQTLRDA